MSVNDVLTARDALLVCEKMELLADSVASLWGVIGYSNRRDDAEAIRVDMGKMCKEICDRIKIGNQFGREL